MNIIITNQDLSGSIATALIKQGIDSKNISGLPANRDVIIKRRKQYVTSAQAY